MKNAKSKKENQNCYIKGLPATKMKQFIFLFSLEFAAHFWQSKKGLIKLKKGFHSNYEAFRLNIKMAKEKKPWKFV